MTFDKIIISYAEIGLKSSNRSSFEKRLMENIRHKSGDLITSIKREQGQLTATPGPDATTESVSDILTRIPGIAHFTFAHEMPIDLEEMKKQAPKLVSDIEFSSFKINCRRHDKSMSMRSMDVNREVGSAVAVAYPDAKVQMVKPDLEIRVGLQKDAAYLSTGRVSSVGGLPTDRKQKAVALLSGGLDSPVAAYMMMKRGCEVIMAHYQNSNQMTASVEDKIVQLSAQLSKYQIKTRLFIIPFDKIQKEMIRHVKANLRMLVYRRCMLRMSSALANKQRANFLIVGDSFSQVASQTHQNLAATYADCDTHILSPLIGHDKREITDISHKIGTFDISSLPYGDCCSYFLPKHPELRASVDLLRSCEAQMELVDLEAEALTDARLEEWD